MVISVYVNGAKTDISQNTSLRALLNQLEIAGEKVAIERNLEIVPKSLYAETILTDGDRLEVVHFIGGG